MQDASAPGTTDAHRRQMARSGALFFGGAAVVTVVGLLLPHEPQVDEAGLVVVAAAAAAVAALLALGGSRLPAWVFPVVAAIGTGLVSLALLFNGERDGGPAGGDEMYYLWVVLYVAYFLGPLATAIQVTLIAVAYAATLTAIDPGPIATSRWVSTIGLVIGAAVVVRLLSARVARLVADLERVARTDRLTGLPNRLAFEERFAHEVSRTARTRRPFALLLADLDRFKEVNDRWGHAEGDIALSELGSVMAKQLRNSDAAARVGGDEFAFILPETDDVAARQIGERIALAVREHSRVGARPVSLSYGISTYGTDGQTLDELTRAADAALYVAKRRGRRAA